MQGFKNLLSRQLLSDDSLQPVVKKSDQHRKITQVTLEHLLNIYKNIQQFSYSFEGEVFQLHHQLTETENKLPPYFIELSQLFKNINVEVKIFNEKSNGRFKELNNVCNSLFLQSSNAVLSFQQHIRNYQSLQQIVFELNKKYARTFKSMVAYLDSYKSSFTDARVIYNIEERTKRYQLCQTTFKQLLEDLKAIQQKCEKLTQKKKSIRQSFVSIQNQMKKTIKLIGGKFIGEIKGFVKNYSDFQKTIVTFLAQKKFSLEKLSIKTFFQSVSNVKCLQYFNCAIDQNQCKVVPAIFVYCDNLKAQYIPYCKSAFANYLKEVCEKGEKRKAVNIQVIELLRVYHKMVEKHHYNNLKQIISNFQRIKKKLGELFSPRLVSFLKSIHSIFQLSIGINEKLLKSYNAKLKAVQNCVNEQNKNIQMFTKELKVNIQKFTGKKEVKKNSNTDEGSMALASTKDIRQQKTGIDLNKSSFIMEDSVILVDNTEFKKQLKQRSEFLIHLIMGFVTKLQATEFTLKENINSIINDYAESSNQFYSLCCEYETIYFGEEEFKNNFKKYQDDIEKTLQKQILPLGAELGFKALIEEQQSSRSVTFEGEINKVQEFKKIKKPSGLENIQLSNKKSQTQKSLPRKQSLSSEFSIDSQNGSRTPPFKANVSESSKQVSQLSNQPSKQFPGTNSSNQKSEKYFELLCKKISFFEGEQYIRSYSCAFYDKIILQGRIYITTHRICFHSKFNTTNIFFGGTFIQIPKKDITKVEKRYNALIFDNSIAITTVNGEMFFTSFFSRDQAYDLITKTFEINAQQQFFQPQEEAKQQQKQEDNNGQIQQQDDIKQQEQQARQQEISKLLESFPYQLLLETQLQVPKINAIKFFRLFDSGQEINHHRKVHKSFLQFSKDSIGHKEIQIHHFRPNILQYLNLNNIKSSTPIKIERNMSAMVPISAAGVPFMPKAARSDQTQSLYFISKNKYIIQSIIQNSGAPYTDCFNVRLRKTISSSQPNKVKFKAEIYINFMKSTMMKGMIESKAVEETKLYFVKMMDEIKKYFKNLEKSKKIAVKGESQHESLHINQQFEQLRKELDDSAEQKEGLQQKVKALEANQGRFKQYLMISVVINIFLVLLLFN